MGIIFISEKQKIFIPALESKLWILNENNIAVEEWCLANLNMRKKSVGLICLILSTLFFLDICFNITAGVAEK